MSENEKKHSELWNAIINKAPFEEIKKMIEAGADLNEEGFDIDFTQNYKHFYFDVFYTSFDHPDCFELVKLFVEHGYDVKKILKNSTNAVTNAVVCPDSRVFFYLYNIDKNIMLDKRDARGNTILVHAVYNNRTTEVIKFLFELGAKTDDTYEHGWGLAHFATSNPNPQIMQTLIDYGVAIEDKDHKELKPFKPLDYSIINDPDDRRLLTPLGLAAFEDTPEICEFLIKAGARLEARDKFGCTPLMLSTRNKNPEVFRLLLKYGANVNALDYMKQGVLNHAIRYSSLEIVKQIAELTNANFHNYNYEIYIKNIEKMKTTRALAHKDNKFLKSLLEVGIDPELPKETKLPYIFLAAENPDLRVLEFLEEKGCDLTLGTSEENIVIHALEHNPNPKVIDYLINKKLFVKDNYFISEHIAKNDSVEIWKRILELGMPFNYQDDNGSSLLIKYLSNNPQNYEVARLLADKTTVNLKDKKGMTACHIACQFADLNYLKILKEAGALLNESENKTGFTPIMVACSRNPNPGFIKFFMDNLVSVRQKTFGDLTLAHFATTNPNPYVMKILIDNAVSYDREELGNLKTPLCFAAASGSLELCELLVKNRCRLDHRDKMGCTPLLLATKNPNPEVFKLLLKSGADINAKDKCKNTVMNYALRFSSLELVKYIEEKTNTKFDDSNYNDYIKRNNNLNKIRDFYYSSDDNKITYIPYIFAAALNPDIRVLNYLREKGCNIFLGDKEVSVPVFLLTANPCPYVIDFLFGEKIDKEAYDFIASNIIRNLEVKVWKRLFELGFPYDYQNSEGATLLLDIMGGNQTPNPELVNLLSNERTVNLKDNYGYTPSHFAAIKNDLIYLQILKESGASFNEKENEYGITPLLGACLQNPNIDVIDFLIKNGANINARTVDGKDALFCSISNPNSNLPHLLIDKYNADIHTKDKNGTNILVQALRVNSKSLIKYFLKLGVEVNEKDVSGYPAIMTAAAFNPSKNVIELLIEKGSDLNFVDENGFSTLMMAVSSNPNPDIIKYLIEKGLDVNAKAYDGRTVLMFAAANNPNPKVALLLIDAGADVNVKDNDGNTAYLIAREYNSNPAVAETIRCNSRPSNFSLDITEKDGLKWWN